MEGQKIPVAIVGAGGLGREVAWMITELIKAGTHPWHLLGYIDDNPAAQGQEMSGHPVLGTLNWLISYNKTHNPDYKQPIHVVCAIAEPSIRKSIIQRLLAEHPSTPFITVIHPSVIMSDRVSIGPGCIIGPGCVLTVDITLGSHVVVNMGSIIGHDAQLSDYVTLYPSVNVSGRVVLESCVSIGTGTQIIQNLKVGEGAVVGAGAVVVRDIPQYCTAVGVPAKPIKFHKQAEVE